jgi:hypothetical protein
MNKSARIAKLLQIFIAAIVALSAIAIQVLVSGPDIDGRTPPLGDVIQGVCIELIIILAFAAAALLLWRHKWGGWLMSISLDGLLTLAAAALVCGDVSTRYTNTPAGIGAFRGDLAIHGCLLLIAASAAVTLAFSGSQNAH